MNAQRLRTVELALTYDCQCDCEHCYASEYKNNRKTELDFKEMKEIIDAAIEQGAIHFLLTGGEPLLSGKLYPVIDYIKFKGGIISLATNGILLDNSTIKKLISKKVDLVEVSMDYCSLKDHYNFRKIKNKDIDIWGKIKKAKSAGLNIGISVLTQKSILKNGEFQELVEKAGRKKIKVSVCYPCTLGNWRERSNMILDEENFKYIDKLKKKFSFSSCEDNCYLKKGCSAGTEKLYISAYGDVTPCPLIPMKFGNIRKESLATVLKRMRKNSYFNQIHPRCLSASDKELINKLDK